MVPIKSRLAVKGVDHAVGSTKIRDTSDDRDGITSDESTIYRDDDIYVTAIFC